MAIDSIWEKIHSTNTWGQYPAEGVIRFVARNYYKVSNRKTIRMLDFGCGGGANTWYLSREGFDVYAFDGSKSAVENTRKKLEKEKLCAHLLVSDGTDLCYESGFFDCVIDNVCIYANILTDIVKMYKEVYRVLKPDGRFYSSVFSVETSGFGTGEMLEYHTYKNITSGCLKDRGISHFYDENELRNILENVGFKDIVVEPLMYVDGESVVFELIAKTQK